MDYYMENKIMDGSCGENPENEILMHTVIVMNEFSLHLMLTPITRHMYFSFENTRLKWH